MNIISGLLIVRKGEPILSASSLLNPKRSATTIAHAVMSGARLTTVALRTSNYTTEKASREGGREGRAKPTSSSSTSSKSRLPTSAASSTGPSGRSSFTSSARLSFFLLRGVVLRTYYKKIVFLGGGESSQRAY